jgi:heparan-sulfate lyase
MKRRSLLALLAVAAGQSRPRAWPALRDEELLREVDLGLEPLKPVQAAVRSGDRLKAAELLLDYFRSRPAAQAEPVRCGADNNGAALDTADRLLDEHVFDLGFGYPPQHYGQEIDWDSNPVGDIEWLAAMQRFYWQDALLEAYTRTGKEKYAQGWVRLTGDWIHKHPLVDPDRFEWLDIQVGIRASRWCAAFERLRRSPAFTPDFLLRFLASVHDHARKSFLYPRTSAHNKSVIEADGLLRIALTFPEFRQARQWLARAYEVLELTVEAQLSSEGVQREWTPSYHVLVASLLADAMAAVEQTGRRFPQRLSRRVRQMLDVWLAMTAPDGTLPMFGDTQRGSPSAGAPSCPVRPMLYGATRFDQPLWRSYALGDLSALAMGSRVFPESGLYFLRSGWRRESVFLALHCSPPAISGHDQPDNGTFELYALGRWLMPDSGAYAYPDTPLASERAWFRRTAVHQTLTLDGRDSANKPRHLLWAGRPNLECVAFENESYPGLTHRRTVFFVEGRFFVLLDEAIGSESGVLELHFQFAPGPFQLDAPAKRAWTALADGANVLLCMPEDSPVDLQPEAGQISYVLNRKQPRPAIACRHRESAPAFYLTLLLPYRDRPPETALRMAGRFRPGQARAVCHVRIGGRSWRIGRDLASASAWCEAL